MQKLRNTVMAYDWGSRSAIARLRGQTVPSPGPEAELWIGAHPAAPSLLEATGESLADRIARQPDEELGLDVRKRFGDRLPFLLKVLAAEAPLSLQAHPDLHQARAGFAREEALGVARTARHRNYKDESHKPELLCALGPFEALVGFRPADETIRLLELLDVAALACVLEPLRAEPGAAGIREAFRALMTMDHAGAVLLVDTVVSACERVAPRQGPPQAQLAWTGALALRYPGDIGVVASLMLNYVHLTAGEAIALPPRSLHSYLEGTGIEIMASSDNVLRGGLTTKHVDVEELLAVLDFTDAPVRPVPVRALGPCEVEYVTPYEDFRLSRIELRSGESCRVACRGPELLLCVSNAARAVPAGGPVVELRQGEAVFVAASDGDFVLEGEATLFRATVGSFG